MKSTQTQMMACAGMLATLGIAPLDTAVVRAGVEPWPETKKLIASDRDDYATFGRSMAIDDGRALIGASGADGSMGAAYLFDLANGTELKRFSPPGGIALDFFGHSLTLDGNRAVIGAYGDDRFGDESGAAYIFDVSTGELLHKISPDIGGRLDRFGSAVALSGNIAAIGAYLDAGIVADAGAVYLYDANTGAELRRFTAFDGDIHDYYGFSVAITQTHLLIGAPLDDNYGPESGSAYLYDLSNGALLYQFNASDAWEEDSFGWSVALNDETALIGAYGKNNFQGAAYLFDLSTGQQITRIRPADMERKANFGIAVALDREWALIGAQDDDGVVRGAGAAYLFDAVTGQELLKLEASDGANSDFFGAGVALDGNAALVGAYRADSWAGSAYLFEPLELVVLPLPLPSGETGVFSSRALQPGKQTYLLYSLKGLGKTFIPQLNVEIDLRNPRLALKPRRADAVGELVWRLPIPKVGGPLPIWFQVVQNEHATNHIRSQIQ